MKVAIFSNLLSHPHLTGVEKYLYQLIHSLSSSNRIQLTLLCQSDVPPDRLPKKTGVMTFPSTNKLGKTHFAYMFWGAKQLEAFDVIHFPTVISPLRFLLNRRIKKIMTVHDLVPLLFPQLSSFRKHIYYKYILKYLFAQIDHFIVPSKAVKKDLLSHYAINPDDVSVVYEGVAKQYRQGSKEKQEYLLAVSTIEPRKNIKRTIDAFIYLKTHYKIKEKLVIVGKKGWSCDDVYRLPEAYCGTIIFKGYVPEAELIKLYQNAKIFIYPSLYEGFGLPVVESMRCGCPVVTSNLSSLPEVAGKAALLVDPHNTNDIASAILKILDDEQFASTLQKKGIEQAKQFTWLKCAQETEKVYETVLNI